MTIKEQIVEMVECKSQEARSSFRDKEDILPNDAIYLARIHSLNGFAGIVQDICEMGGLSLSQGLALVLRDDMRKEINERFPYLSGVFQYLAEHAKKREGATV